MDTNHNESKDAQHLQDLPPDDGKTLRIICPDGEKRLTWKETYEELSKSALLQVEFRFPDLTTKQRATVHMLAEKLGMLHFSTGTESNRELKVVGGKKLNKPSKEEVPTKTVTPLKKKSSKKEKKLPIGISEILDDFLYLGSCRDVRDLDEMKERNIKYVLNCAKEWKNYHEQVFTYHNTHWMDVPHQTILEEFDQAFEFIEHARSNNQRVFVHCIVGKSRSASLVIAYLMRYQKMTFKDAHDHVKSKRSIIRPNEGFVKQLLEFELSLYGNQSVILEEWSRENPAKIIQIHVAKPKISKEEEIQKSIEFVQKYVSNELMEEILQQSIQISKITLKNNSGFSVFLSRLSKYLENQRELQEELLENNMKFKGMSKGISELAKPFFFKKVEEHQQTFQNDDTVSTDESKVEQ